MEINYTLIIILFLWELYWKAHALWVSARNSHKGWFIAILIINSMAIVPIYYLYKQQFFKK